jgi:hypothetical protein
MLFSENSFIGPGLPPLDPVDEQALRERKWVWPRSTWEPRPRRRRKQQLRRRGRPTPAPRRIYAPRTIAAKASNSGSV